MAQYAALFFMKKYNSKEIEKKWQKLWETNKTSEVMEDPKKQKFYSLIEFPYPSAEGLHVGHPRPFTAMDVVARKRRMEGYNVLFPIGFDAFGLPTENFAIKTGRPPAEVTAENIANFTRQLKSLGYSFDWSRAVNTTDPSYYRWTQWIFLQLFKHGLAYKKNTPINWCPRCKIGLANEEVVSGACERCGYGPVEKRNKEQWMLAITKYADKLLAGLKTVDYITPVRLQQENWIGRSEGAEIKFELKRSPAESVQVFTTRPDTLFGATFMVVSPELAKEWLDRGWKPTVGVKKYIEKALKERSKQADEEKKEKTGVDSGIKAVNPATNEEIPVWVADYVLAGYGTDAIMAVPAHDERDWEFAKKFELPMKVVVAKRFGDFSKEAERRDAVAAVVVKDKLVLVLFNKRYNIYRLPSGGYEGSETAEQTIQREIMEESGYTDFEIDGDLGLIESNNYLVDKQVQRLKLHRGLKVNLLNEAKTETAFEKHEDYENQWCAPAEAVERLSLYGGGEEEFVKRAFDQSVRCFSGEGSAINSDFIDGLPTAEAKEKMIHWLEEHKVGKRQVNYKLRDWVFSRQRYWGEPIPLVYCEACAKNKNFNSEGEKLNPGWVPIVESELPLELPNVEKYQPTDTGESPLAAITDWVKTTCPRCGGPARRETDTMPNWAGSSWYFLAYALGGERSKAKGKNFWDRTLLEYWTPVDWYNGGMEHTVLHLLYSRFWNQFLFDLGLVPTSEPYKKRTSHGMILGPDGEKMSKSRGNVINPDEMVKKFGADAFRTYIMFMGPFDQAVMWDTNGLIGVRRFLDRLWALQGRVIASEAEQSSGLLTSLLHRTIKKVSDDIEAMRFNTAVAKLMELVNEMTRGENQVSRGEYQILIKLLSPFAPHIAQELWEKFGDGQPLAYSAWPEFDPELAREEMFTIVVQVNGKVRDQLTVAAGTPEAVIKQQALASEKVRKWTGGKEPTKVIYVPGRLVSVVV